MKKRRFGLWAALFAAWVASACVGGPLRPDAETVSRARGIHLVPMEAPPLQVDAAYAASGPASLVHYLPRYTLGMARSVGILQGVAVLIELSSASHVQAPHPPQVQPLEAWLPAVELTREAARQLAAAGKAATMAAGVQPLPGMQDRGRTSLMENWLAPVRSWYNDETPSTRYAELGARQVDAVVEVGISNYEVHAGGLLLQVHLKLIDPASGRLLARARASSFTPLPPMDEVFASDARELKAAVLRQGKPLITTCLQEIGMVPK